MESILRELYFGNVRPCERERIRDPEYVALIKKIDSIVVYFGDVLPPEGYAKFTEMRELQAQVDLLEEVQLFEYAFCTGALMMLDVFGYSQNS